MSSHVNMLKLSVGSESVESLIDWQRHRSKQVEDGIYYHITRMWPKRADEILAGGSIFWVIAGLIQARQTVTGFRELTGEDGIRRCAILLDRAVIRTQIVPKRPFQGWRYLPAADAPGDLRQDEAGEQPLPPELAVALSEIGVR